MVEHSGGMRSAAGNVAPAAAVEAADRLITLSVTVSPKHIAFLTAQAKRHDLSMSAMLRVILNRWCRRAAR